MAIIRRKSQRAFKCRDISQTNAGQDKFSPGGAHRFGILPDAVQSFYKILHYCWCLPGFPSTVDFRTPSGTFGYIYADFNGSVSGIASYTTRNTLHGYPIRFNDGHTIFILCDASGLSSSANISLFPYCYP